jgi:acyl-CoA thioester hydrolase
MGVVHHANYIVWFELSRTRLCSESGFHYADVERLGYLLMVTGVEVRYYRPSRYGDSPRVACWCERMGSRGMRFAYEVSNQGERVATGATEHVWVEKATGRPCRPPAEVRVAFERLAGIVS